MVNCSVGLLFWVYVVLFVCRCLMDWWRVIVCCLVMLLWN